jgi:serine/threonine protein kinase
VPRATALQEGDPVKAGVFRLVGRVGAGRQAVVYLGVSPDGQVAAIKILRPELRTDGGALDAFDREVSVLRLAPDAISPRLYGQGWDGGHRFLASEYLNGLSLEEVVGDGGPLAGTELRRFAAGISRIVAELHERRIQHGDIKPRHVIIGPCGRLFLIDFGIAGTGDERLRRRDLFSLAAVILYAAGGRFPYEGTPLEIATRTMAGRADVGMLPSPWRDCLSRCLDPNRRRCPGAADVLKAVSR